MPTFTINHQRFTIEQHEAFRTLLNGTPGLVQRHYVQVGSNIWPVKDALAALTGLDPQEFTSQHAGRVLRILGFQVHQRDATTDPLESLRRDLEAVLRRVDTALAEPGKTDGETETLLDARNRINEWIVLSRIRPSLRQLQAEGGQP